METQTRRFAPPCLALTMSTVVAITFNIGYADDALPTMNEDDAAVVSRLLSTS